MSEPLIKTQCQQCDQPIEFPPEGMGMTVECPHCGQGTVLREDIATHSETISAADLSTAFGSSVPHPKVPMLYQLAMVLVTVFMVLLPIIYVAIVLATAWGVYWYAVHAKFLLTHFQGGLYVIIVEMLLYFGPIFGGSVAVFFMFKPLFARGLQRQEGVALNPALEPRLYQFIAGVNDLLAAPVPQKIELDCRMNASAGFRRGWLSFFGNDLVLTIGLPLVAGLSARQLAAVIAHEFGHFTQGNAMRLGYIINRIDGWFMRVVFERDSWDKTLEDWSNSVNDSRLTIILACAHLAVWLSRLILKLLMMCGHAASCFLSRQMEYHADSCAVNIAGSEVFESMVIRLRELDILNSLTYKELGQLWKKRHILPESVPDYTAHLEKRVAADFHEQSMNTLLNETAGLWATHPTAAQRIQKARQQETPGVFNLDAPASALFSDFIGMTKTITFMHYRENLELAVLPAMVKPLQELK
jgi:Zn-dependent protease with chaperone function